MKKMLFALLTLLPINFALAESKAVDELNELLAGELSAVTTYQQALEKVKSQPAANQLKEILNNHRAAVKNFQDHITSLGGKPVSDAGAWGSWAQAVTGTAKVFGEAAALKALKEGEEHGLKEYKELTEEDAVPANIKQEVNSKYIPGQQAHIQQLDRLIEKA